MTVTYNATLRGARMQAVLDAVDAGTPPGSLEILDSSDVVLAAITLGSPSFTRSGGVLTLASTPLSDTSANASGTASKAQIKNAAGTVVISGLTVGTADADIIMNSTSITSGQQVAISSGTITHSNNA
jgi:hypothetical protein